MHRFFNRVSSAAARSPSLCPGQGRKALVSLSSLKGDPSMLRDWLLILAALSPAVLALLIVLLVLLGRVARHERN